MFGNEVLKFERSAQKITRSPDPVPSAHFSASGMGAILISLCPVVFLFFGIFFGGGGGGLLLEYLGPYLLKFSRGIYSLTAGCKHQGRRGQAPLGCSLDNRPLACLGRIKPVTDRSSHQSSPTHLTILAILAILTSSKFEA